jgi:NitT/TauT family transport system substrate-binding protein
MRIYHVACWSRREFLHGLTLAGTAGLLGLRSKPIAAEPRPETTALRLVHTPAICLAPHYVAEILLQAEGFTDVQYVKTTSDEAMAKALAAGHLDFALYAAGHAVTRPDAGDPFLLLASLHVGCYELFAAGQIDAYLAFPPEPQELRAKHIGHVVVNTGMERPWSQYFCCMVGGSRAFVQQYPVATKRWLRALFKAADLCAQESDRAARLLVEKGYTRRYDYALQSLQDVAYR